MLKITIKDAEPDKSLFNNKKTNEVLIIENLKISEKLLTIRNVLLFI